MVIDLYRIASGPFRFCVKARPRGAIDFVSELVGAVSVLCQTTAACVRFSVVPYQGATQNSTLQNRAQNKSGGSGVVFRHKRACQEKPCFASRPTRGRLKKDGLETPKKKLNIVANFKAPFQVRFESCTGRVRRKSMFYKTCDFASNSLRVLRYIPFLEIRFCANMHFPGACGGRRQHLPTRTPDLPTPTPGSLRISPRPWMEGGRLWEGPGRVCMRSYIGKHT